MEEGRGEEREGRSDDETKPSSQSEARTTPKHKGTGARFTPRRDRRKHWKDEYEEDETEEEEGTMERKRRGASPFVPRSRFKMWWWWVGLLAVGFVYLLVGWPYAIFMWQIAVPLLLRNVFLGIFALLISHIALGLLLTSYMRTVLSDPGYVPLDYLQRHDGDNVNICNKCDNGKPERYSAPFPLPLRKTTNISWQIGHIIVVYVVDAF